MPDGGERVSELLPPVLAISRPRVERQIRRCLLNLSCVIVSLSRIQIIASLALRETLRFSSQIRFESRESLSSLLRPRTGGTIVFVRADQLSRLR